MKLRTRININEGWSFTGPSGGTQRVNLPHTWNAIDGQDGNGSYARLKCWYARSFETPVQPLGGGRVYVEVLAAGQQASVYVNGQEAVYHEGGLFRIQGWTLPICAKRREKTFW